MSVCAPENNSGWVIPSSPITVQQLNAIDKSNQPPIMLAFAPRHIVPSYNNDRIDDTVGNTCTLHHLTYDLVEIQLANADMAKGYRLPMDATPADPACALYLTFAARPAFRGQQGYTGIVMCFPIWGDAPKTEHGEYIDQLLKRETDPNKIVNLESLFYTNSTDDKQVSIGYSTCAEIADTSMQLQGISLYVLIFPRGIRLQLSHQGLKSQFENNAYQIPSIIRYDKSTMNALKWKDGEKVYRGDIWSKSGELYTTTIDPAVSAFRERFEYFAVPVRSSKQSSDRDTSRYKCIPAGQLENLHGDFNDYIRSHVRPGKTTEQEVDLYRSEMAYQLKREESGGLSTSQVEGIVAGGIAFVVVGLVAFGLMKRATTNAT